MVSIGAPVGGAPDNPRPAMQLQCRFPRVELGTCRVWVTSDTNSRCYFPKPATDTTETIVSELSAYWVMKLAAGWKG